MKTAQEIMHKDYLSIDTSEHLSRLIGLLIEKNKRSACIFDNGSFAGIFLYSKLLNSHVNIAETKVGSVVSNVSTLSPEHDLLEIAALMFENNAFMLPVVKAGKVIGIVTVFDVFGNIGEVPELKNVRIKEVRHPDAIFIDERQSINKALEIMFEENIDRLPVVSGMKVTGFLSYADVIKKFYSKSLSRDVTGAPFGAKMRIPEGEKPDILKLPVKDFMHEDEIISVEESDLLADAARLMVEKNVTSVLVPFDGLYAILTKRDILEAIMHARIKELKNIQYVGLESLELDSFAKGWVEKISSYYSEKFGRFIQNEFKVKVHLKQYTKGGKSRKYSVHVHLAFPGRDVVSDKAYDWNIRRALHKAFKDIEHQLRHRSLQKERKGRPGAREFYS